MPVEFIYETAITIDHEKDEMRLDTTLRSMATKALRAGFKEVTTETSKPYRRFVADSDMLRLRKAKGIRKAPGRPFGKIVQNKTENSAIVYMST